jgi:putative spermidine/putrescine transport system permease protein
MRLLSRHRVGLMLLPALLVVVLLFGGGMVAGIGQSFGYFPAIGLHDWTFDNYIDVVTDQTFLRSLWLTFRIAFTSTLGSMIIAVAIVLVLRHRFAGSRLGTFVFQIPLPVPHLVAASGLLLLFTQSGIVARFAAALGLIDRPADFPVLVFDRPGVSIILTFFWKEVPFIGLVVLAILKSIGPQYEELAQTLGAGPWQRFRYVLLPLMLPGLLSTSVIVFAFTFANYEIPLLLGVRSPTTLPVLAFRDYGDADLGRRPQAMAISVIVAVISVMLLAAYRRLTRYAVR